MDVRDPIKDLSVRVIDLERREADRNAGSQAGLNAPGWVLVGIVIGLIIGSGGVWLWSRTIEPIERYDFTVANQSIQGVTRPCVFRFDRLTGEVMFAGGFSGWGGYGEWKAVSQPPTEVVK